MLTKWLGTTYIPMFDLDTITKLTVCETPKFSSTVQRESFFQDTDGILEQISRIDKVYDVPPHRGLQMFQRATVDIVQRDDGQYLQFMVSGNQGTNNLTFHIRGRMMPIINYINRYANTLDLIGETYVSMTKEIMFLELSRNFHLNSDGESILDKVWKFAFPDKDLIPQEWLDVQSKLEQMVWQPKTTDLMRLRQIDLESVMKEVVFQSNERRKFLLGISGQSGKTALAYLEQTCQTEEDAAKAANMVQGKKFYNYELDKYIWEYEKNKNENVGIPSEQQDALRLTLESLGTDRYEQVYELTFETTIDEFRQAIGEFNEILPTLPTDTRTNKICSMHTFLDWKRYFDESTKYLVEHGLLFVKTDENGDIVKEAEYGTDDQVHQYVEYYVDIHCTEPVIDYSYCYDQSGNVIHDRFDYWSVDDFK